MGLKRLRMPVMPVVLWVLWVLWVPVVLRALVVL